MKFLRKTVIFFFLAVFAVNAQAQEQDNTRTSVYLHPAILVMGLNAGVPMIYSTVEVPFSLYNALIVKPNLWISMEGKNELFDEVDLLRLGSDFGIRHYPAGRGEGFYLQGQLGLYYLSIEEMDNTVAAADRVKFKSFWYDFMGYLGWAYKFTYINVYSDTGLGYVCVSGGKSSFEYSGGCTLMWDVNLGIGFSF